jgi:hypothetical protein
MGCWGLFRFRGAGLPGPPGPPGPPGGAGHVGPPPPVYCHRAQFNFAAVSAGVDLVGPAIVADVMAVVVVVIVAIV